MSSRLFDESEVLGRQSSRVQSTRQSADPALMESMEQARIDAGPVVNRHGASLRPGRQALLCRLYYPGKKVSHPYHILTRRASEGSEALPSLARRVSMSFFGARVISARGLPLREF